MPLPTMSPDGHAAESPDTPSGVLVFDANDPSGASGLAADIGALASIGVHPLPIMTGNHSRLRRWLLPDWCGDRPPGARVLAMAAGELGTHVTLVTGIARPERGIDNTLATPHAVLATESVQSLEGSFAGAGATLSAAFAALIASDCELTEAFSEALSYLGGCLDAAYRPGMGNAVPDRLFWAQAAAEDATTASGTDYDSSSRLQELSPHDTQH